MFAALKMGRNRGWVASKHDVKGAFLNAKIPKGKLVIVRPPEQWVRWGLVEEGELWTLDRQFTGCASLLSYGQKKEIRNLLISGGK